MEYGLGSYPAFQLNNGLHFGELPRTACEGTRIYTEDTLNYNMLYLQRGLTGGTLVTRPR